MRVLLISNGNGEDRIAAHLGRRWRERQDGLSLQALALVGSGLFYTQARIPLLPPRFSPPSQGFAYLNPRLLLRDFQAGLGGHLCKSIGCLLEIGPSVDFVLAVGDIVAVIAASLTGRPFAFFGAALSDHYLGAAGRAGKNSYDPLQRWLLKRKDALVFGRDALTAANLRRHGLDAHFVGNPMRDCMEHPRGDCPYSSSSAGNRPLILLLPGSHADALANFALTLELLAPSLNSPKDFAVLCAPQLAHQDWQGQLRNAGWEHSQDRWQKQQGRLWLLDAMWMAPLLQQAQLAIGLAGTANEQCVGAGLPVIAFATPGTQYTWAFGEAQKRLLGAGLFFQGQTSAELLARQIDILLAPESAPPIRLQLAQVSAERFGPAGGDERMLEMIAELIQELGLATVPSVRPS